MLLRKLQSKFFKRKINKVVYTAITGDYDELLTPSYLNDDWDYICFTDNENIESDFWEIRKMEDSDLDKIKKARMYKILPHVFLPEYEYSLWIDGNFRIISDINEYIKKYAKNNLMMCIVHPDRDCIYGEADACIEQKKDSPEVILKQIDKYKAENYPKHYGLIASGILFRKHNNPQVIKLMNTWCEELTSHSRRDQLSFNYACWKNNFEYDVCDLCYWGNEFFEYFQHK
jgi:hypothetical protein